MCVRVLIMGVHRKFEEEGEVLAEGNPFVWMCVCVYMCESRQSPMNADLATLTYMIFAELSQEMREIVREFQ